jgi:hypothetical protein
MITTAKYSINSRSYSNTSATDTDGTIASYTVSTLPANGTLVYAAVTATR